MLSSLSRCGIRRRDLEPLVKHLSVLALSQQELASKKTELLAALQEDQGLAKFLHHDVYVLLLLMWRLVPQLVRYQQGAPDGVNVWLNDVVCCSVGDLLCVYAFCVESYAQQLLQLAGSDNLTSYVTKNLSLLRDALLWREIVRAFDDHFASSAERHEQLLRCLRNILLASRVLLLPDFQRVAHNNRPFLQNAGSLEQPRGSVFKTELLKSVRENNPSSYLCGDTQRSKSLTQLSSFLWEQLTPEQRTDLAIHDLVWDRCLSKLPAAQTFVDYYLALALRTFSQQEPQLDQELAPLADGSLGESPHALQTFKDTGDVVRYLESLDSGPTEQVTNVVESFLQLEKISVPTLAKIDAPRGLFYTLASVSIGAATGIVSSYGDDFLDTGIDLAEFMTNSLYKIAVLSFDATVAVSSGFIRVARTAPSLVIPLLPVIYYISTADENVFFTAGTWFLETGVSALSGVVTWLFSWMSGSVVFGGLFDGAEGMASMFGLGGTFSAIVSYLSSWATGIQESAESIKNAKEAAETAENLKAAAEAAEAATKAAEAAASQGTVSQLMDGLGSAAYYVGGAGAVAGVVSTLGTGALVAGGLGSIVATAGGYTGLGAASATLAGLGKLATGVGTAASAVSLASDIGSAAKSIGDLTTGSASLLERVKSAAGGASKLYGLATSKGGEGAAAGGDKESTFGTAAELLKNGGQGFDMSQMFGGQGNLPQMFIQMLLAERITKTLSGVFKGSEKKKKQQTGSATAVLYMNKNKSFLVFSMIRDLRKRQRTVGFFRGLLPGFVYTQDIASSLHNKDEPVKQQFSLLTNELLENAFLIDSLIKLRNLSRTMADNVAKSCPNLWAYASPHFQQPWRQLHDNMEALKNYRHLLLAVLVVEMCAFTQTAIPGQYNSAYYAHGRRHIHEVVELLRPETFRERYIYGTNVQKFLRLSFYNLVQLTALLQLLLRVVDKGSLPQPDTDADEEALEGLHLDINAVLTAMAVLPLNKEGEKVQLEKQQRKRLKKIMKSDNVVMYGFLVARNKSPNTHRLVNDVMVLIWSANALASEAALNLKHMVANVPLADYETIVLVHEFVERSFLWECAPMDAELKNLVQLCNKRPLTRGVSAHKPLPPPERTHAKTPSFARPKNATRYRPYDGAAMLDMLRKLYDMRGFDRRLRAFSAAFDTGSMTWYFVESLPQLSELQYSRAWYQKNEKRVSVKDHEPADERYAHPHFQLLWEDGELQRRDVVWWPVNWYKVMAAFVSSALNFMIEMPFDEWHEKQHELLRTIESLDLGSDRDIMNMGVVRQKLQTRAGNNKKLLGLVQEPNDQLMFTVVFGVWLRHLAPAGQKLCLVPVVARALDNASLFYDVRHHTLTAACEFMVMAVGNEQAAVVDRCRAMGVEAVTGTRAPYETADERTLAVRPTLVAERGRAVKCVLLADRFEALWDVAEGGWARDFVGADLAQLFDEVLTFYNSAPFVFGQAHDQHFGE